jgi:hypothetical protein
LDIEGRFDGMEVPFGGSFVLDDVWLSLEVGDEVNSSSDGGM